ncbi:MAG: glycerophosphodiester phosphodiesterase family protein [bacterium]|nr:glycerophosphodiester phosphodiesterase family protein [bacterium]
MTAPAEPTDAPPTATTTTTTTTTAAAEADDDTTAAAGADVLELDVQLTADNVLIVQHDDTVDRTTEANGPVAERTLAEIQTLDNAYWFAPGRWGDRSRPPKDNLPGCHN